MSETHEEESAAPPSLVTWDQAEVLGKRTFDDVEAVIGPNKKLRAQEHFRLLVPAKCAGSVIGKGGENIKKVREACPGAIIKVPDAQNVPERIIQISCGGSEIPTVLGLIGPEIFKNLSKPGGAPQEAELSLLIPSEQMGGVIGKGGAVIKKIREDTGAFLKSFSAKLPCCDERVLLYKGELNAMIAAIIMTLEKCAENPLKWNCQFYDPSNALMGREEDCGGYVNYQLEAGATRLQNLPHTQFVRAGQRPPQTRPAPVYPNYRPAPAHAPAGFDMSAYPGAAESLVAAEVKAIGSGPNYNSFTAGKEAEYAPQPGYESVRYEARGGPPGPDRYGGAVPSQLTPLPHFASSSAYEARLLGSDLLNQMKAKHPYAPYVEEDCTSFVTKEVTLENHMTGSIIGPRGSRIAEIRDTCGAKIRIGDVNSASEGERLITISGTQQECHLAEYMLQSSVQMFTSSSKPQHGGRRKLHA